MSSALALSLHVRFVALGSEMSLNVDSYDALATTFESLQWGISLLM
jgi:hypothetical protein